MEGLKERLLKFRFNGLLVVALLFAVIALILFIERSGIQYNYGKTTLELLPADKIVTKEAANAALPKNTVVLWNSKAEDSINAMDEFPVILADMKVGYDLVDLSCEPFPDLSKYTTAVVIVSDFEIFGQDIVTFRDWVYAGGRANLTLAIQKNIYSDIIEHPLGIVESSWGYTHLEDIFIDKDFMVGGGRGFTIEDGYDSVWSVQLDKNKAKIYAWINNEKKTPLIWETNYGKGKFVVVNMGLCEKAFRGFYAAAYSLLDDVAIYPVINASVFYLDDFPSQIPEGNNEYILRDYGASIRDFYVNIWWPSMMNLADKYKLKYTGLAIVGYDDDVDGTISSQPDEGTFLTFGNMLLRQGGEIGYHGYNHQPLCMDECDYTGWYDYKTWKSTDAMEITFDRLVELCENLFPGVEISLYVPPSNIMTSVGENFLFETYPHIKTISGIYFQDGDFKYSCTQEFEVLPDGKVRQPRIISGCDLTPFMEIALISELNMHYMNSHFTHPDDALDPERGAELGWDKLSKNFDEYLSYLYTSAPSIRNFTGSEASAAVQRYVAVAPKIERVGNKIVLKIENFYDDAQFFVRFNSEEFKSAEGGELTHLTGNLYLLSAESETVTINLK